METNLAEKVVGSHLVRLWNDGAEARVCKMYSKFNLEHKVVVVSVDNVLAIQRLFSHLVFVVQQSHSER